jgi:hypothetical protein
MVKKTILTLLLLTLIPFYGFAEGLLINPAVVDQTARIRDNYTFSVLVENKADSTIRFYPVLANFSEDKGILFSEERSNDYQHLSDFVQIQRGRFQLKSGETERLDLTIDVNLGVEPKTYYGKIIFSEGSTRKDAEENAKINSYPEAFVRVQVVEGIVENAQLKNFTTDKDIFLTDSVQFLTDIHNIGNRAIKPKGSIFVYKERNNKEVAVIDINEENQKIDPQSQTSLKKIWSEAGFGKYKAVLRAEYGEETTRDLQGTIYFWVLPWPLVLIFFSLIFGLVVVLIILIKKISDRARINQQ